MKRLFMKFGLALAMLVALFGTSRADLVTIGTGTLTTGFPFYTFYHDGMSQFLYRAADFTANGGGQGTITSIGFNVQQVNASNQAMNNFRIFMQNTTLNDITAPIDAGWIQVYQTAAFTVSSTGWVTFNITPFDFTGPNLIVKVCFDNQSWTSNSFVFGETQTGTVVTRYADNGVTDGCLVNPDFSSTVQTRPNTQFNIEMGPTIVNVFPQSGAILQTENIYSIAPNKPGVQVKRKLGDPQVSVSYEVRGPLPQNNLFYMAYSNVPSNPWINLNLFGEPFTHLFTTATGTGASKSPFPNNGNFDFINNPVVGGEYEITAKIKLLPPGDPFYLKEYKSKFLVSLANDLAVTSVSEPKQSHVKRYASGKVPIRFEVKNVGVNPVSEFKAFVRVTRNGAVQFQDSVHKVLAIPLTTGQGVSIEEDLRDFQAFVTGDYQLEVWCVLLGANDQAPENNRVPVLGETYTFYVAYEQEPQADAIFIPNTATNYYVGRPFRPVARFSNNGITDMSNVPVYMYIENIANPGVAVYLDTVFVQDIPSGITNNFSDVIYKKAFVAPGPGTYRACAFVSFPGDPVLTNNEVCVTFSVIPALSGNFTIGMQNAGNARNYPNMNAALNDLFLKGISGPTVFELTDDVYNEGDIQSDNPALDFRSKIVGVDANNTITFRPSSQKAVTRESIRINLHSASGIGMIFGQSNAPTNANSPVFVVEESLHKKYSNNEGYITFDGGPQKSFVFTPVANIPFRVVAYMSNAKNITIKNSILTDGLNQPASDACVMPNNFLNASLNQFQFESDWEPSTGRAFSAAVYLRSKPPVDPRYSENRNNLDTLTTNNINILNNEISNFGYGIASQGIGALLYSGRFKRYVNHDNNFHQNKIFNIAKAGVFLGFEENTKINENRIFNVTGACGNDAAGILAGETGRMGMWGFYNVGLIINANEISNINGHSNVYGVKIQQVRTEMNDPAGKFVTFPDVADNNKTTNNIIWGLNATNATANKYGIRYYTERAGSFDVPFAPKQFTVNDRIINNTVVIDNDAFANTGVLAGIALQQTRNTFMHNNAVAFLDNSIGATDFASPIFYHGYLPNQAETSLNRNAYWVSNPNVPVYRFIETTDSSTVIEYSSLPSFKNLSQWQYWTGQETHSVFGDFMQDMVYVGNNPQNLRVKTNPVTPKGSILNNRGDRLPEVTTDIDGRVRGVANQRFDIGAVEFNGRFYNSDIEVMTFVTPGAYKEALGTFADAEYIMTQAPVNVIARIRNSGNIQQTDRDISLKIYRERPSEYGNPNFVGELVKTKIARATVSSTDDLDLDFLLADEGGLNDDWTPHTYADLRGNGYTIPPHFATMQPNVTPRYRLVVNVESTDEVLTNNQISKVVRFYLKRASLDMVLSTENSHITIDAISNGIKVPHPSMTNLDQIAGRLNVDSLLAGFRRIGWVADYTLEQPRYDFDIFERNGWEPKSVNYAMYRTLVWSDADENPLTRLQVLDLTRFFDAATVSFKKNSIFASQELIRINQAAYPDFVKKYIRGTYSDRAGNNLPVDPTIDPLQKLVGFAIARNLETEVIPTGWSNMAVAPAVNDNNPMTVAHDLFQSGNGISRVGMYWKQPTAVAATSKIASIATTTLQNNVIFFGLDWRHFGNIDFALRGTIDYIDGNGGTIIPVELLSFDAIPVGNRVELNWTTASEINSSRFDVERAEVSSIGIGSFAKIDEVNAKGNTSTATEYGPVIDRRVNAGNTYAYRLKMIDVTGEFTYSNEKIVTLDANGGISLSEVKPNPVRDIARFDLSVSSETSMTISLFDINGKAISLVFDGTKNSGSEELRIDTKELSAGSYTLVVRSGNNSITRSFTVVR